MVRNEDFDNLTLNGDAVATGTDLSSHTGDTTNPHSVTASQTGALPDSGGTVTGDINLDGTGALLNIVPETIGILWQLDSATSGQYWGKIQFNDAVDGANNVYWASNRNLNDAFKVRNDSDGLDLFNITDSGLVEVMAGDLSVSGSTTIGSSSEISESAAGSTVIQNTAGNPVNIQLSPSGRAYLVGNTTATTISTQDTWYEISGTWNASNLNYLSHTSGALTYDGDVATQVEYNVGGSYSSPDNTATYEIGVFTDGSLKPSTVIDFSPPRAGESLALPNIFGFTDSTASGTSHSVRVRCTSGTSDITIRSLNFIIKG